MKVAQRAGHQSVQNARGRAMKAYFRDVQSSLTPQALLRCKSVAGVQKARLGVCTSHVLLTVLCPCEGDG